MPVWCGQCIWGWVLSERQWSEAVSFICTRHMGNLISSLQGYSKVDEIAIIILGGKKPRCWVRRWPESHDCGGEAMVMLRVCDTKTCVRSCSPVLPALLRASSTSTPLPSMVVDLWWPQASQRELSFQISLTWDFLCTSCLYNMAKVLKPLWAHSLAVSGHHRAVKHHLRWSRTSSMAL